MKISLYEDKCCGAGSCVMAAPDVFAEVRPSVRPRTRQAVMYP